MAITNRRVRNIGTTIDTQRPHIRQKNVVRHQQIPDDDDAGPSTRHSVTSPEPQEMNISRRSHRMNHVGFRRYDMSYHPIDSFINGKRSRNAKKYNHPMIPIGEFERRVDIDDSSPASSQCQLKERGEASSSANATHSYQRLRHPPVIGQTNLRRSARRLPGGRKPVYDRSHHPADHALRPTSAAKYELRQEGSVKMQRRSSESSLEVSPPLLAGNPLASEKIVESNSISCVGPVAKRKKKDHQHLLDNFDIETPNDGSATHIHVSKDSSNSGRLAPTVHVADQHGIVEDMSHAKRVVAPVNLQVGAKLDAELDFITLANKDWLLYRSEELDVYELKAGSKYFKHYQDSIQRPLYVQDTTKAERIMIPKKITKSFVARGNEAADMGLDSIALEAEMDETSIIDGRTSTPHTEGVFAPLQECYTGLRSQSVRAKENYPRPYTTLQEIYNSSPFPQGAFPTMPNHRQDPPEEGFRDITMPAVLTGDEIPANWGAEVTTSRVEEFKLDYGSESNSPRSLSERRASPNQQWSIEIHEDQPGCTPKANAAFGALRLDRESRDIPKENLSPHEGSAPELHENSQSSSVDSMNLLLW